MIFRLHVPTAVFLVCVAFPVSADHAAGHAGPPAVTIAQGPLFGGAVNVHPNLLLSLSVEFPTVGIAYRGDDGKYRRSREYIGYFNPAKCYAYEGDRRAPTDDAYFRIHSDADPATRECDGKSFSGNFMNWAASSAIDMLRYALTGGDRVVDRPGTTVLQRAVLPDSFYADPTYFPRRKVQQGGDTSAPSAVTPFKVDTLYVVSCRNRVLFSDISSGVTGSTAYCTSQYSGKGPVPENARDKKLGEYLARVQVCDAKEGPARSALCLKYGAHYKPIGELQRNAARVRVGAMGYLLDDAPERYGGVLRAPLKYVGATRFEAPEYVAIANDRPEWDANTGVFHPNPEQPANRDDTGNNSGVLNYLNKFGRSGRYKTHDPVGELYYEGLRYLQGRQPTPFALQGMTEAMKDGFPVVERWADPVLASCQRNYILAIADVNTHWDRYIPGNLRTTHGAGQTAHDAARAADAATAMHPALDVRTWTEAVGRMEADAAGMYGNPFPNAGLSGLEGKDTGAGGHGTYYMAGLAYWANTNDIRFNKRVRVKTFAVDVDEGGDGRIDGNRRGLQPRESQLYLAAKYGGFDDRNGDGNPFITLDKDGRTLLKGSNAEWDNGAGGPANYFLAGQPQEMIAAIRRVFSRISGSNGTISGIGLSTSTLGADGAFVYQPGFDPSRWSGSLRKLALSVGEDFSVKVSGSAHWDAGEILTGVGGTQPIPVPAERRIFTAVTDKGRIETIPFAWNRLSSTQQDALDTSPLDGKKDGLGPERLAYLRGARDREIGQPHGIFRTRDRVLGDIVNSNPLHVGAPGGRGFGPDYTGFVEKHRKRSGVVYVGANDGMLHAFDAGSGRELFAYVPDALFPALPKLADPDYVHRPYVDGALSAADAIVNGKWRTVLAGGFGGGAQGLFALDVSDPASFGAGLGVLFEFTDADDPDMGNLIGAPAIARFRTNGQKGEYKHFVVAASGMNNYVDDGEGRFNSDGAGALFLLALDKPAAQEWKSGVNYYKFRLPAADSGIANGLAQAALVAGPDGAVRYAYLGDLQGNLWRLDFDGDAPWRKAASVSKPIFVARDAKDARQPVSTRPRVVFAPTGGYLVLFGTGKFVENRDAAPGSFSTQSFYAFHDTLGAPATLSRAHLAERSTRAIDGGYAIGGEEFRYGGNGKRGWYLDFSASQETGERIVAEPAILNGKVFFNSLIPGRDPCSAGGGRQYELAILSGLLPGRVTGVPSKVGLLGAPVLLEASIEVGPRNAIGAREAKRRQGRLSFGTDGVEFEGEPTETSLRAGRFSWREILNWQEMRDGWKKK